MLKPTVSSTLDTLLCPSSQPGMEGARVLGVVQQTANGPEVTYLDEPLLATPEVLAMAAPVHPTEVLRLAARCQTNRCPQFDGTNCGLAARIVQILPAVVDQLPQCQIRPECRWFRQEGAAACCRCPQISTVNYDPPETMRRVVKLPPPTSRSAHPFSRLSSKRVGAGGHLVGCDLSEAQVIGSLRRRMRVPRLTVMLFGKV
jgi:hypothetical protein